MAHVRRPEEPLRRAIDKDLLGTRRGGEPERTPVVVVAVGGRGERTAVAREPGGLAVAQPLGRTVEREARRADARVGIGVEDEAQIARTLLFLASCVSSTSPSASSRGGRYIPNRPR